MLMRHTHLARLATTMLAAVAFLLTGTAPPAHAGDTTVDQHYDVKPLDSITVSAECPGHSRGRGGPESFLENVDYAPSRLVGKGVSVTEDGGVGVTRSPRQKFDQGPIWGFVGTATNWVPKSMGVTITLHCTDDVSRAWTL